MKQPRMPRDVGLTSEECVQARALVSAAKRIVIVTHVNPDGDAVGSSCGLALFLESMGKEVVLVNKDPIPEYLSFVPGSNRFQTEAPEGWADLLIFCDCGERVRVGDALAAALPSTIPSINIDHHVSNSLFASLNVVEPASSSTAEVLVGFLRGIREGMSTEVAECLITGILTDTGCFRYRSASPETLLITADLIRCGARYHTIVEHLFSESPLRIVVLHALALQHVSLVCHNKVALVVVEDFMYEQSQAGFRDTEGLAERLRDIEGVKVGVLIRWDGEVWRVSLRGKGDAPDLSLLAADFGGGGHIAASAFRWRRGREELLEKLTSALAQFFDVSE